MRNETRAERSRAEQSGTRLEQSGAERNETWVKLNEIGKKVSCKNSDYLDHKIIFICFWMIL